MIESGTPCVPLFSIYPGGASHQCPLPGRGWPRRGRETAPAGACGEQPPKAALGERRNSGRNLKISTNEQTSTGVATKTAPRRRSSHFQNHYVTARIPHQSWHRLWRHHDSFPPGEAIGAAAPDDPMHPIQHAKKSLPFRQALTNSYHHNPKISFANRK